MMNGDPTPTGGGDDAPGIEHVDARLQHIAEGVRKTDRDADQVADLLSDLADGYRESPGAMVQAASDNDDDDLRAEIVACYQYVEVIRSRFARRLEDTADRLADMGNDREGGT